MLLKIEDISDERINEFLNTLPSTSRHIFNFLFMNSVKSFPGHYSIKPTRIQKLELIKPDQHPDLITKISFPSPDEIKYGTLKTACCIKGPKGLFKGVYLQNCSDHLHIFYRDNKKYFLEKIN